MGGVGHFFSSVGGLVNTIHWHAMTKVIRLLCSYKVHFFLFSKITFIRRSHQNLFYQVQDGHWPLFFEGRDPRHHLPCRHWQKSNNEGCYQAIVLLYYGKKKLFLKLIIINLHWNLFQMWDLHHPSLGQEFTQAKPQQLHEPFSLPQEDLHYFQHTQQQCTYNEGPENQMRETQVVVYGWIDFKEPG